MRCSRPAGRTVTETDVVLFAGLTGDWNQAHTNRVYARDTPFGRRLPHGPLQVALGFGLVSRLGVFDGTGLAILDVRWTFRSPVFIGDRVRARMVVVRKRPTSRPDRGVLVRRVDVLGPTDELVSAGTITMLVRRRPSHE